MSKLSSGFILLAAFLLQHPRTFAWQLQYAPIMTDWAQLVNTNAPLPEYPRPQMVRSDWLNLNGIWQFQAGATNDPVPTNQTLSSEILVPFPMESALSGIMQHHDFSWYRRTFTIPPAWTGQRILLHLDAVDWESEVFINGQSEGIHRGGYDEATYDITAQLSGTGPQELIVRIYDPTDAAGIPRGKQTLYPGGIMYTATSGIWQPVWLEPAPASSIADLKLVPDIGNQQLHLTITVSGPTNGLTVYAVARNGATLVGSAFGTPSAELLLPVPNLILWSPTNPFLYDLQVTLSNGVTAVDSISSYFGMRKISLATNNGFLKMQLNDQFIFQFGPLDQGFWPDGIYTAPTDDALKSDLEQEKLFGFNMVRKHIKVERQRWYYWADKLGILVWQDMPSVNSYTGNPQPIQTNQFESELTRMVQTHWNHPSIIMWVLFNEGQGQHDTAALVQEIKTLDPSRLVNEASGGNYFGSGDILDIHSYPSPACTSSATEAVACGEFGGVGLGITNHTWAGGWGYLAATNGDDLAAKFQDFSFQLSDFVQNQGLSAAVYTQITDVETELNGLLTYDRKIRKPDADRIRRAIISASTPATLTTVVPTSQTTGQGWLYTMTTPLSTWTATNFDDSAWTNGLGGFGANNPPNTAGLIRTTWNTANIWLRRTFNPGALTSQQISNLFFTVYHDEDVEIYINGVLAGSASGYVTSYGFLPVNAAGQAALLPNAVNILAVHCRQTDGGQYIDVGIAARDSNIIVPARPVPATPTGLHGVYGNLGISLGWNTSTGATNYSVKRSLVSGGPYTNLVLQTTVNAVTDSALSPGATYYYVVSAANSSGASGDSSEISVTSAAPVLPVLQAWFRADGITGLTNGTTLAAWPDATGNGYSATQNISARQPTYVTGAINGLPAVHFNSATATWMAFARPVQDDFTILCVYRSSQGEGIGTQFYQGVGLVSGEVGGVVNDFGISLNLNGKLLAGTGNPDVTVVSSGSIYTNGFPHLVTFKRTRNTGALALYVDGTLQGTATGGTQLLTSPSQLVLGAQQTLVHFLTGDIAEVKIYATALSDTDRIAEENALSCKYGLSAGAPPATPLGLQSTAGNRKVFVSWTPTIGATGYKLNWSINSGGPFTQLSGNLTTNSFVHTNAVLGQTNYYQVAAFSACGVSAYSLPDGVLLALPVLAANMDAGTGAGPLSLRWPDWANDWQLWSATNLTSPVVWSPVTNSPAQSNGFFNVIIPIRLNAEFFRLVSP
jgi:hypothetical protein